MCSTSNPGNSIGKYSYCVDNWEGTSSASRNSHISFLSMFKYSSMLNVLSFLTRTGIAKFSVLFWLVLELCSQNVWGQITGFPSN